LDGLLTKSTKCNLWLLRLHLLLTEWIACKCSILWEKSLLLQGLLLLTKLIECGRLLHNRIIREIILKTSLLGLKAVWIVDIIERSGWLMIDKIPGPVGLITLDITHITSGLRLWVWKWCVIKDRCATFLKLAPSQFFLLLTEFYRLCKVIIIWCGIFLPSLAVFLCFMFASFNR
jgi:hypothetical protein